MGLGAQLTLWPDELCQKLVAKGFRVIRQKTLSLTSIMCTTGNPAIPPASPEAMQVLTARLPADASIDAMIDNAVKAYTVTGSPAYDYDTPKERAARA